MASWELRAKYMSALAKVSLEIDRERDRAQMDSSEPSDMIAAWERAQEARKAMIADRVLLPQRVPALAVALGKKPDYYAVPDHRTSEVYLYSETHAVALACTPDTQISLGPVVYPVLEYLVLNAGQIVTFRQIYKYAYRSDHFPLQYRNTIQQCIMQIRKRLGSDIIVTHRGVGYSVKR
jgi:hypothetical protein